MKCREESNKDAELAKVRELIAEAYKLMNSDTNKCIKISKEALQLSDKYQFGVGQGMAYMHIGLGYFHRSEYYNALKNYLKAEPFFQKENYWYGLRSIYNNIGLVYNQWNDLENALKYFHKNLALEAKFNGPKLSSTILNNIGRIYLQLDDFDQAVKYFTESLKLCEEHKLPYMNSVCYDNLGKTYLELGDTLKAEEFYEKSISLKTGIKDYAGLSNVYQNKATLLIKSEEYKTALKMLDKAMDFASKVNEQSQIASIYLKYANVYEKLDDPIKQKEFLEKSLSIAELHQLRSTALKAYTALSQFYQNKTDYKKALYFTQKGQQIKDFLSDEKKNSAIQEMKIKMEVERTEHEKEILQHKNDELESMNAQILDQKKMLEQAEKELKQLNQNLEKKVIEETKKRRLQEQIIIQKSKLESLGRLAAGIAHEINQPVGLIKIATQNLFHKYKNNKITDTYLKEKSAFVEDNINRINKIIEHIRLFSREQQQDNKQKIDVKEIVNNALSMIGMQFKNHNIAIQKEFKEDHFKTIGNKYRLEQVVLNLLSNARDALDEKFDELDDAKKIIIRLYPEGNIIVLEVEDNGCGLSQQTIYHVFDPFYTTKPESRGTGLGLSICYGIIQEMDGNISMESKKGKFTLVKIKLPSYSRKA